MPFVHPCSPFWHAGISNQRLRSMSNSCSLYFSAKTRMYFTISKYTEFDRYRRSDGRYIGSPTLILLRAPASLASEHSTGRSVIALQITSVCLFPQDRSNEERAGILSRDLSLLSHGLCHVHLALNSLQQQLRQSCSRIPPLGLQ